MEVSQAELDTMFQEYRAAEVKIAHFVFSSGILDKSVQSVLLSREFTSSQLLQS